MAVAARPQAVVLAEPAVWPSYFPGCAFSTEDRKAQLMQDLASAFQGAKGLSLLEQGLQGYTETTCKLLLSCEELLTLGLAEDLEAALQCQPAEALQCLAAAAHQARPGSLPAEASSSWADT